MPWQIGIDEAGYGPNLGPLVQSAIGVRVSSEPTDLWTTLAAAVRKCGKGADQRMFVDDSKKVYGPGHGLKSLELSVLAILLPELLNLPVAFREFLNAVAPESIPELAAEPWFDGNQLLPIAASPTALADARARFHRVREQVGLGWFWARSRVTSAALFNALLEERDNKADVLAHGLRWLIDLAREPDTGDDSVSFAVDRLGGRHYHGSLLESACRGARVEVLDESSVQSRYRLVGRREWIWSFEIEAESRHFSVALASMLSKYLREVLMGQFNRFWQRHVAGLKPTAGYPVDAVRFRAAIEPAMAQLQISEHVVWRRK